MSFEAICDSNWCGCFGEDLTPTKDRTSRVGFCSEDGEIGELFGDGSQFDEYSGVEWSTFFPPDVGLTSTPLFWMIKWWEKRDGRKERAWIEPHLLQIEKFIACRLKIQRKLCWVSWKKMQGVGVFFFHFLLTKIGLLWRESHRKPVVQCIAVSFSRGAFPPQFLSIAIEKADNAAVRKQKILGWEGNQKLQFKNIFQIEGREVKIIHPWSYSLGLRTWWYFRSEFGPCCRVELFHQQHSDHEKWWRASKKHRKHSRKKKKENNKKKVKEKEKKDQLFRNNSISAIVVSKKHKAKKKKDIFLTHTQIFLQHLIFGFQFSHLNFQMKMLFETGLLKAWILRKEAVRTEDSSIESRPLKLCEMFKMEYSVKIWRKIWKCLQKRNGLFNLFHSSHQEAGTALADTWPDFLLKLSSFYLALKSEADINWSLFSHPKMRLGNRPKKVAGIQLTSDTLWNSQRILNAKSDLRWVFDLSEFVLEKFQLQISWVSTGHVVPVTTHSQKRYANLKIHFTPDQEGGKNIHFVIV